MCLCIYLFVYLFIYLSIHSSNNLSVYSFNCRSSAPNLRKLGRLTSIHLCHMFDMLPLWSTIFTFTVSWVVSHSAQGHQICLHAVFDVNVPCSSTHGWCYAAHGDSPGVGMSTFLAVAHTVNTPHVQCKFEKHKAFHKSSKIQFRMTLIEMYYTHFQAVIAMVLLEDSICTLKTNTRTARGHWAALYP